MEEDKRKKKTGSRWRDFLEVLSLALLLALFLRTFVVGFYRVSTGSMAPTLMIGDFVWVYRGAYGFKLPFTDPIYFEVLPQKGDLILFRHPEQPTSVHIKRVIGVPGDHIHIKNQQILVNEKPFARTLVGEENYVHVPGHEFMKFWSEDNGSRTYTVMYAQNQGFSKEVGPLVVPPGEIFVMGDNRDASDDSRYWGAIPLAKVEGKMMGIWFSLGWSIEHPEKDPMIRWSRIGFHF